MNDTTTTITFRVGSCAFAAFNADDPADTSWASLLAKCSSVKHHRSRRGGVSITCTPDVAREIRKEMDSMPVLSGYYGGEMYEVSAATAALRSIDKALAASA